MCSWAACSTSSRALACSTTRLVVLTADHGATFGTQYYGKTAPGASTTSDTNWYYGPDSKPTVYNDPSPAIQPLVATGNVQFSYQSTSIQTWLKDVSSPKRPRR